jgi:hypothetical protein
VRWINTRGQSIGSWLTFDVGYRTRRRATILGRSLCNAIHDSTPSLKAELLCGLDAAIRNVEVENDNEDEQRQDESERITWETEMTAVEWQDS